MVERATEEFLSFDFVYEHYNSIKYTSNACDGKWYPLKDYYAFCFAVKDKPFEVCLDTGGPMDSCDFDVFQFTKTALFRNGKKIATLDFGKMWGEQNG